MKDNIITGQQIGLLGGPLYSTYKALGAVSLAGEIEGNAIYWLETNDADFNEINHIDYIDKSGELRTLKWDIDTRGYSCGYIEVDEKLIEILNTFFSTIYQTEYTEGLREMVLNCYQPGLTLGEASFSLASQIFSNYSLRIFDPSDKEFRRFSKEILLKEAERGENGRQCNLFCLENKQRKAVFKKNDKFYFRNGENVKISEFDLLPNVKTRNLCQDAFFNTHTYIAGPGEIKYIKELDKYYQAHNIKKSRIRPRMSIDLLEPRIKRALKKTGLSLADIGVISMENILKDELKRFSGFDKKQVEENLNKSINDLLNSFRKEGIEPGNLKKMLFIETKKIIGEKRKEVKMAFETKQKNIEMIFNNIRPFGTKQDRVFNIFYYMNMYGGIKFIDFLFNNYDISNHSLEVLNG